MEQCYLQMVWEREGARAFPTLNSVFVSSAFLSFFIICVFLPPRRAATANVLADDCVGLNNFIGLQTLLYSRGPRAPGPPPKEKKNNEFYLARVALPGGRRGAPLFFYFVWKKPWFDFYKGRVVKKRTQTHTTFCFLMF